MTNDQRKNADAPKFDLAERTAIFGIAVISFAKTLRRNEITRPLINQLVRSGTSIGANYLEADEADSRKEFRYRVSVARREARETKHWIRMIVAADASCREQAMTVWREADELVRIFSSIRQSMGSQ